MTSSRLSDSFKIKLKRNPWTQVCCTSHIRISRKTI